MLIRVCFLYRYFTKSTPLFQIADLFGIIYSIAVKIMLGDLKLELPITELHLGVCWLTKRTDAGVCYTLEEFIVQMKEAILNEVCYTLQVFTVQMKGFILNRSLLHSSLLHTGRLHSANGFLLTLDIMDYVFWRENGMLSLKYESTCSSCQVFLENGLML